MHIYIKLYIESFIWYCFWLICIPTGPICDCGGPICIHRWRIINSTRWHRRCIYLLPRPLSFDCIVQTLHIMCMKVFKAFSGTQTGVKLFDETRSSVCVRPTRKGINATLTTIFASVFNVNYSEQWGKPTIRQCFILFTCTYKWFVSLWYLLILLIPQTDIYWYTSNNSLIFST